jgi:hypothetical protein
MSHRTEVHERLAAMLLLTLATGAAFWVQQAAIHASGETLQREQQLQELQRVVASGAAAGRADLRRLDGLFEGQELVWESGVAGSYLTMRERSGGSR